MAELSKAIARLMEERERAQPKAAVADAPKLRAVLEKIRAQVVPGERPVADAFVRQLLERTGDMLEEADVEVLAGIAVSAYRFVSEWRQVGLLRAYVNHGVQIGSAPSRDALVTVLVSYPRTARALWEYFEAKFDPQRPGAPRDRLATGLSPIEERFVTSLDAVQSVVEDRILRALFQAVAATTRTNYFRHARNEERPDVCVERHALAIKLASGRISQLRTARGAWECLRRHVRELGRDADRDTLTVIGIGDMSGDVFGNGLLLSRRLCLRAAFNHQHIFLDPNPDPARSFAERERLFRLLRSSWSDYNPSLISAGGGVFPRNARTIPLAPAARHMLTLDTESLSGEEVIRAILRMPADLLWNGGVGTDVKARDETHAAADDSSNVPVRVDASELRVKIVVEGGNLGFTQRARVEYALRGGRINTDAIDNSGGVDMSDHEVNLKMALSGALESGQLPLPERNRLLAELTPDVTRRVLAYNQRQARVLSLDHLRSETRLAEFRELLSELEAAGELDRRLETLPDRETLRNRRGIFLGLTRPELAVLLAHDKLVLQRRLLASNLPDDAFFEPYLRGYFPEVINMRCGHGVRSHRLRRKIIAVAVANLVVDTMGATFVPRIGRETGAETVAVVRAWAVVVAVSGAQAVWEEMATLDPPLPVPAEAACWLDVETALARATKWIVQTQPAELSAGELSGTFDAPVQEFMRLLRDVLPETTEVGTAAAVEALAAHGTPRALAQRLVALDRLAEAFEIAQIAREFDLPRSVAAQAYYRVSDVVNLDWLRVNIAALPGEDRWDRRAVEGLSEGQSESDRQSAGVDRRHQERPTPDPGIGGRRDARAGPSRWPAEVGRKACSPFGSRFWGPATHFPAVAASRPRTSCAAPVYRYSWTAAPAPWAR